MTTDIRRVAEVEMTTPADWYQDPEGAPGDLRYWDGTQWTEHRAPADRGPTPEPVAAPPPAPAAAPPPPASPPPPPATPEPEPEPEPTITPGVAAGMTVGAATTPLAPDAQVHAEAPPPPPAVPPPAPSGGSPGPAAPKRSRAPLFITLAIVVVVLIVGGVVGLVVLGGGSSKKSPSQWASSFCKNKDITAAAQKVDTAKNSAMNGDDLDAIATYLDSLGSFLETSATVIPKVGTLDTAGGKQMSTEVPTAFRAAAQKLKSVAADVRDGSTRSLQAFSTSDWDPLTSMSAPAQDSWDVVKGQLNTSSDCADIDAALEMNS